MWECVCAHTESYILYFVARSSGTPPTPIGSAVPLEIHAAEASSPTAACSLITCQRARARESGAGEQAWTRDREKPWWGERESWRDETGSGMRMRKKRKTSAKWNWATTWMTRGSEERWEDETSRGNLNPNHSSLSLFHRHFSSLSFPLTLLFVVYPHFIIFSFGCIRHVWNYSCVVLTEQLLICVHSLVTWINLTRSSLAKSHYCCCTHLKLYMDANKHLHQFCFWDCPPEKKNSTTCLSKGSKNHICDSTCRRKSGYVIMEQKSPH